MTVNQLLFPPISPLLAAAAAAGSHPAWEIVGVLGAMLFVARFLVQWYATEKQKQVTVPVGFWWLSLAGSLLMLGSGVFGSRNLVVIISNAFNWIPFTRNLVIHYRHQQERQSCPGCALKSPPQARYCAACGTKLSPGGS